MVIFALRKFRRRAQRQATERHCRNHPLLPARWLLLDDFQSENYLKNFHGRVGIVIDGKDEIVPAKFGRRLFDSYTGPKRLWEYPKSNHVKLGEPPEKFWQAAIGFWRDGNPPK